MCQKNRSDFEEKSSDQGDFIFLTGNCLKAFKYRFKKSKNRLNHVKSAFFAFQFKTVFKRFLKKRKEICIKGSAEVRKFLQ